MDYKQILELTTVVIGLTSILIALYTAIQAKKATQAAAHGVIAQLIVKFRDMYDYFSKLFPDAITHKI